jgi:thiamine pyrophosphate-dependent acetolactate synthase large subunit-like protein
MRGYDVVADSILRAGVDTGFGLLGSSNLAVAGALVGRGARFFSSRHESGAVCLAAGYAWASGRPALCTVTHGPGLGNALTALTSAVRDRLPVVLVTGDIRDRGPWMAQHADHAAMVKWTGAEFRDCRDPARLAATVAAGFAGAVAQRRPVVVNVPAPLLDAPAVPQSPAAPAPARAGGGAAPGVPDRELLGQAVEALTSAERPVVLAGRGAVWSGAGPALRRLAGAAGALLTTTLPAIGLFAGDPYDLGVCGGYSTATARALLREADCLLVFGASLNGYTTAGAAAFPDARVIHCDTDPAVPGRHHRADLGFTGDAASAASALTAALRSGPARSPGYRLPEIAERIAAARAGADYPDLSDRQGLDPRAALRMLDPLLPADRQVVIDVGHFSTFPSQALPVPGPGHFFPATGFGSVGLSVASGVGAAVGRRIRTVVVVGDGGTLMSLGELETLSRHRPPVTVVVLNDRAYGAEIHHLRNRGFPETLAEFPPCDLAAVASSLGLPAVSVRSAADLAQLVPRLPADAPALIDVRVTRAAVADRFTSAPVR